MSNLSNLLIAKRKNDDLIEQAILDAIEEAIVKNSRSKLLQLAGTVPEEHPLYPSVLAFAKRHNKD